MVGRSAEPTALAVDVLALVSGAITTTRGLAPAVDPGAAAIILTNIARSGFDWNRHRGSI
jgi:hypothetical protein